MRGKKAKQLRRYARTVAQGPDYPEKSGYDIYGTFWSTPARRLYRQMKRNAT